jgi:hypothetical protein
MPCLGFRCKQRSCALALCVASLDARHVHAVHRTPDGERQPRHNHAVARSKANGLARLVRVVLAARRNWLLLLRAPVHAPFSNALCCWFVGLTELVFACRRGTSPRNVGCEDALSRAQERQGICHEQGALCERGTGLASRRSLHVLGQLRAVW